MSGQQPSSFQWKTRTVSAMYVYCPAIKFLCPFYGTFFLSHTYILCYLLYRDVDETTRANQQATASPPVQSSGQGMGHVTPSPSTGFKFVTPSNQPGAAPTAQQPQATAATSFIFGSPHGTGMHATPPTTLAGQFLSASEGKG